jgi:uncharacterized protein
VVTLEYQVHGKAVKTGAAYDNRFVSIVAIKNRKIVRWRDYMDSLAAWQALTGRGSPALARRRNAGSQIEIDLRG